MKLLDLSTISDVPNGANSVSEGKVIYGKLSTNPLALPTVSCIEHGAMLNVAIIEKGKIWRCPACNVGAFEQTCL